MFDIISIEYKFDFYYVQTSCSEAVSEMGEGAVQFLQLCVGVSINELVDFSVFKFQGGDELELLSFGELGGCLDLGDGGLLDGVVFGLNGSSLSLSEVDGFDVVSQGKFTESND